jgi:hypothetical protein
LEQRQDLVAYFIPALGAILIHAEDKKGSPLTEEEAIKMRDGAMVIMLPAGEARTMDQKRGYKDIDPENLWHDWQTLRDELGRKPSLPKGPKFDFVRQSDEEMQQAAVDARATLDSFRGEIERMPAGAYAMLKTRLVEGGKGALMWLTAPKAVAGVFVAEVFEVPAGWKSITSGQTLAVRDDEVMD